MVASSRYQNYFPILPAEIQQDVFYRMNELLAEEKEYCDKGNYAHMTQILTSIALYGEELKLPLGEFRILSLLAAHLCLLGIRGFVAKMGIVLSAGRVYPMEWVILLAVFLLSVAPTLIATARMAGRDGVESKTCREVLSDVRKSACWIETP